MGAFEYGIMVDDDRSHEIQYYRSDHIIVWNLVIINKSYGVSTIRTYTADHKYYLGVF